MASNRLGDDAIKAMFNAVFAGLAEGTMDRTEARRTLMGVLGSDEGVDDIITDMIGRADTIKAKLDPVNTLDQAVNALGLNSGPGKLLVDPGMQDDGTVMTCGTCGQGLNKFLDTDGNTVWLHSRAYLKFDHEPDLKPVPGEEYVERTCDFCGQEADLYWLYVGQALRTGGPVADGVPVQEMSGNWRACKPCSELIEEQDMERLLNRSYRNFHLTQGMNRQQISVMRQSTLSLWMTFLPTIRHKQYIGPRRIPTRLNPRMMPKLQEGLLKHWRSAKSLTNKVPEGHVYPIPGVHAGREDDFIIRYDGGTEVPEQVWRNHTDHLCAGIRVADLYWISKDFTQLATMAGKDFEKLTVTREQLPSTFGFMMFEDPIGEVQRPNGPANIVGVTWTLVPDGIWVNLYIQGEDNDPEIDVALMRSEVGYLLCPNPGSGFPFGVQMPNPEEGSLGFISTIFAAWYLMTQPGVAEARPAPVDKKLARSYQRANNRKMPDVQLIDLRRQPQRSRPEGSHEGRQLTVRVYRRGHWKNQAYGPQWSLRKQIYVSQYIAGPEGAPLKTKPTTVRVLR